MIQLLALVICAWLGWQRAPFPRWPLAVIAFAVVAGCSLVIAYHHAGAGPDLDIKLMRSGVSLLLAPLCAYWLVWWIKNLIERRRTDR